MYAKLYMYTGTHGPTCNCNIQYYGSWSEHLAENEGIRCYAVKIQEREKLGSHQKSNPGYLWLEPYRVHIQDCEGVGGYPAVVTQLQSTGGSSQSYPGFNSW